MNQAQKFQEVLRKDLLREMESYQRKAGYKKFKRLAKRYKGIANGLFRAVAILNSYTLGEPDRIDIGISEMVNQ